MYTQISQKRPDKFENILLTNAFSGKHLKEKCLAEAKLQLSFASGALSVNGLKYYCDTKTFAYIHAQVPDIDRLIG